MYTSISILTSIPAPAYNHLYNLTSIISSLYLHLLHTPNLHQLLPMLPLQCTAQPTIRHPRQMTVPPHSLPDKQTTGLVNENEHDVQISASQDIEWKFTRKILLGLLVGSDSERAKMEKVRGMLMGLSKHDKYTSVDAAVEALKRHEREMDPRAEKIANRVREATRLDRGRVFVKGYLKGYEDGRVK